MARWLCLCLAVLCLGFPGCPGKKDAKTDKSDKSEKKDEPVDKAHATAAKEEGHKAHPDGGSNVEDLEATYTPRRLLADEEECDEIVRDALSRLRQQARELAQRAQSVSQREAELQTRERAQTEAQTRIDERVQVLERLSREVTEHLAQRSAPPPPAKDPATEKLAADKLAVAERARKMTQMVSGMPAQRAAAVLGQFKDDDLAVSVLESLPQDVAGKVLSQMRPEAAAKLAERMGSDRHALAAADKDKGATAPAKDDKGEGAAAERPRERGRTPRNLERRP